MKTRFQADADFNQNILNGIIRREPAIDFQTATVAGLAGRLDLDVLIIAADEERILVSHDKKTMPWQFGQFISSQVSPGLLIVPQHLPVYKAIDEIILYLGGDRSRRMGQSYRISSNLISNSPLVGDLPPCSAFVESPRRDNEERFASSFVF